VAASPCLTLQLPLDTESYNDDSKTNTNEQQTNSKQHSTMPGQHYTQSGVVFRWDHMPQHQPTAYEETAGEGGRTVSS
jgi:hypothetical protein